MRTVPELAYLRALDGELKKPARTPELSVAGETRGVSRGGGANWEGATEGGKKQGQSKRARLLDLDRLLG